MGTVPRRFACVLAAALATGLLLPASATAQRGAPTYPQVKAAETVPEYAAVLRALDSAKPESILEARDAAIAHYSKAARQDADAVFRQFQAFYDQVLWKVPLVPFRSSLNTLLMEVCDSERFQCRAATGDAFFSSTRPADVVRRTVFKDAVAALARYRSCGIWFTQGEGSWYAAPDPAFVSGVAARLPLGELGEWVTFWAAEAPQRIADDASLVIEWDDLRQRLGRWEAFERAHPELPETQVEVRPHVAQLVAIYVFGISNTRAYDTHFRAAVDYDVRGGGVPPSGQRPGRADDWQMRIDPRLRSSYDRFLVENRGSSYYKVIDGIVTRIKRSNGAPTREQVDFLRAELTDPYFESWLRSAERWLR